MQPDPLYREEGDPLGICEGCGKREATGIVAVKSQKTGRITHLTLCAVCMGPIPGPMDPKTVLPGASLEQLRKVAEELGVDVSDILEQDDARDNQ